MARPELLDHRPSWGGGKLDATTVLLEPLGSGDAGSLVERLLERRDLDDGLRARPPDAEPRPAATHAPRPAFSRVLTRCARLCEQKGNIVGAAATRARQVELDALPTDRAS